MGEKKTIEKTESQKRGKLIFCLICHALNQNLNFGLLEQSPETIKEHTFAPNMHKGRVGVACKITYDKNF